MRFGPVTVSSGLTCVDGATILGPVTVKPGASLIVDGGLIAGSVRATRPELFEVHGTQVVGLVTVTGATGPAVLDQAKLIGSASFATNKAGVRVDTSTITGPVSLIGNTGGTAVVAGNRITGLLACAANNPAPGNDGRKNTVRGLATGQCARL
jgi:5'-nucleotidase